MSPLQVVFWFFFYQQVCELQTIKKRLDISEKVQSPVYTNTALSFCERN